MANTVGSFLDALPSALSGQTGEPSGLGFDPSMLNVQSDFYGGKTPGQYLSGFGVTDPVNQRDMAIPDPLKGNMFQDSIGGLSVLALPLMAAGAAGAFGAGAGALEGGALAGAGMPAGMAPAGFGLEGAGYGMMSAPQLSSSMAAQLAAGVGGAAGAAGGAGESVSGSYAPAAGELSSAAASYGGGMGFDPSQLPTDMRWPANTGGGPGINEMPQNMAGGGATTNGPVSPAVTAPGAAPQGTTGFSFVDDLIKQMRANPLQALGLGMTAASLAGGLAGQKGTPPEVGKLGELGGTAQQTAQRLLEQARSGQLSPAQQGSLDQTVNNTKNQIRQYFASIGMSDSTAARQAEGAVDREALAMKEQFLNQALTQGLNAIGVASGPLSQAAQYTLGQDKNLQQAFGQFGQAIGNLFGRQAGTPTPQPTRTG